MVGEIEFSLEPATLKQKHRYHSSFLLTNRGRYHLEIKLLSCELCSCAANRWWGFPITASIVFEKLMALQTSRIVPFTKNKENASTSLSPPPTMKLNTYHLQLWFVENSVNLHCL